MTVRDWIVSRSSGARPSLTERILTALGRDADAAESRTAAVCLAAAAKLLETLVAESRFGRDTALDLLAVDALTTYAFEHASASAVSDAELATLATQSAKRLGQLTVPERV